MRLLLLTALTMAAFAANSVLNRWAVAPGLIGPVDFAVLRVVAGAVALAGLILWRRGRMAWPGWRGRAGGGAGLSVYLIGFSLAYLGLDAATGALVLFGMVQVTMFAGALAAGEAVPGRRWAGAGLALAGLALIALPGGGAAAWEALALMTAAGVGWGVYSLTGRGAADPLGATAWNFILSVPVLAALGGAVALAEVPDARFWAASALVLGGVALGVIGRNPIR